MKRDFRARFMGSAFGVVWAVLQPLSLVAVYWFVFTRMFQLQGRGHLQSVGYVEFLIAGLLPWIGLNEALVRSTTSIVDNAQMVRRLPLKSALLVVVPNVTAILFEVIALAIFIVALLVRGDRPTMLWLLPAALLIQFALQLAIGFFLAPAYVFLRDLLPILTFALSVLFYLCPILYPAAATPVGLLRWNPLTPILGLFRSALLSAALPPGVSLVSVLGFVAVLLAGGWAFFRRAQGTLADLI